MGLRLIRAVALPQADADGESEDVTETVPQPDAVPVTDPVGLRLVVALRSGDSEDEAQ